MNIKHKITRTVSLFIIISFIILALVTAVTVFRQINRSTEILSTQLFSAKANEVSDWLNTNVNQLEIIEQANEIQNFNLEEIKLFVDNLNLTVGLNYGNQWGTFAIGDESGIGYVSKHQYIDISNRDYFIEGKTTDKKYILSIPVVSKTDSAEIALIHYPLRKNGTYFGFINAAINLNRLTEICRSISFYEGTSFIIDDDGNLYTKNSEINENDIKISIETFTDNRTSVHLKDNTYFCTRINNTDSWYLCTRVDNRILYASLINLMYILSVVFSVLMIICLMLSLWISDTIAKPISKLNDVIKKAATSLEVVAQKSSITEINSLSDSFNQLIKQTKDLIRTKEEDARLLRLSEIKILQSQINPHFLYNTLDTLNWKAVKYKDEDMENLISSLCDFYRISLSDGNEFITIEQELHHVQSYINIQSIRFKNLFRYTIDCPDELMNYYSLKVILQPLVENAITHGLRPKGQGGLLNISIIEQGKDVVVYVNDNGVGMDESTLSEVLSGLNNIDLHKYGLYNVNQRIRLTYGEGYGINIESEPGKGTCVKVVFPKFREGDI